MGGQMEIRDKKEAIKRVDWNKNCQTGVYSGNKNAKIAIAKTKAQVVNEVYKALN